MITLFEENKIKLTQAQVGFLIPFLDTDRRYCMDPSLLRFTEDAMLKEWNEELVEFLKLVRHVMKKGDIPKLRSVLNIGEAPDAGLGYCEDKVTGSGMGKEISEQVIKILAANKEFAKRGFLRLEELQWMDKNIGPDRISDLAINILKRNIIKYTQDEAKKYGIPTERVRVNKVFEPNTMEWISIVTEMPINPQRIVRDAVNPHPPILLLPKEVVRPLPLFLSYDEFYGFIDPDYKGGWSYREPKIKVVKQVIDDPKISDQFIKEREIKKAHLYRPDFDSGIHKQIAMLDEIPVGSKQHANIYRNTVNEILQFIFSDNLSLYKIEKGTILNENRRDIIYQNIAQSGIFADLKNKHSAGHIVVDTKNTEKVTSKDVAQVSNYLNDEIGRVAFIVSRKKNKKFAKTHSHAQVKDHKNVVFFIADEDLKRWVTDLTRIQHITGNRHQLSNPEVSIVHMYSDIMTG